MTTMSNKTTKRFMTIAGIALLAAAAAILPANSAQAQSGYRVCGAWHSSLSGRWGTGLVTKVGKDDSRSCDAVLNDIVGEYGQAWSGSWSEHIFRLEPCETFAANTGLGGDPCSTMGNNTIYKYTSAYDGSFPQSRPAIWWWRD